MKSRLADEIVAAWRRTDVVFVAAKNYLSVDIARIKLPNMEFSISLKEVAEALGMKPSHLVPLFGETRNPGFSWLWGNPQFRNLGSMETTEANMQLLANLFGKRVKLYLSDNYDDPSYRFTVTPTT